jgi:hypothetical protein
MSALPPVLSPRNILSPDVQRAFKKVILFFIFFKLREPEISLLEMAWARSVCTLFCLFYMLILHKLHF